MKKLVFATSFLFLNSAYAFQPATSLAPVPAPTKLLTCSFLESMSASFGYSSVYTIEGKVTAMDPGVQDPFYEVNGTVNVAIDDTASTNVRAQHIADTTATLNNHPWGSKVQIDITSTQTTGASAFRILVFSGVQTDGSFEAYKIDSLTGNGLSGSCSSVDPRLVLN
jgi:hypothetical protein